MSTEEIKLMIFRQVDALDTTQLNEFYGIMQNYLKSKHDIDEWIGVSKEEQDCIEDALQELNDGKGVPHEEVMGKLRKKHLHA